MSASAPRVSVVIPAFNQARFLRAAIDSALAQTYRDREIVVVDDGSTDETPEVIRSFGSAVRGIRQPNKGLAGARNTGITHAAGEFIALLDSDDVWLPGFLEHMMALAARHPGAGLYYAGWRYIDSDGRLLPEPAHLHAVAPADAYRALLRANFLSASAVVLHRSAGDALGWFDEAFRRLEDWEFWIRLVRHGLRPVGSPVALVQYRLHGQSLSVDGRAMGQAARELVQKHFGEPAGRPEDWPWEKRWAYGGAYRYLAVLASRKREDWSTGGELLRNAIAADPSLANESSLYHELAWSSQPVGHRRLADPRVVDEGAHTLIGVLDHAFGPGERALGRPCYARAHLALGAIAYSCGQYRSARRYLVRALAMWPPLVRDPQLRRLLLRAHLGRRIMDGLRRMSAPRHSSGRRAEASVAADADGCAAQHLE